jgi:hypothetical protein
MPEFKEEPPETAVALLQQHVKQDFKLTVKLQFDSKEACPKIQIYPTKKKGLQHFVVQCTDTRKASSFQTIERVYMIDEMDHLVKWFLVDRVPCGDIDKWMTIFTVDVHKEGSFNENSEMVFNETSVNLGTGCIDAFKRVLLDCARMSRQSVLY